MNYNLGYLKTLQIPKQSHSGPTAGLASPTYVNQVIRFQTKDFLNLGISNKPIFIFWHLFDMIQLIHCIFLQIIQLIGEWIAEFIFVVGQIAARWPQVALPWRSPIA